VLAPTLVLAVLLVLSGSFKTIAISSDVRDGGSLFSTHFDQKGIMLYLNISFSKTDLDNRDLRLDCTITGQEKGLTNAFIAGFSNSYPGRSLASYSPLVELSPAPGVFTYKPAFWFPPDHLLTFKPEYTPYDMYESPKLVIATDEEVSLFAVSLSYELPSGYVASVSELRNMTYDELVAASAHIDSTLPKSIERSGLAEYTYFFYVDFVIVRTFDQIVMLSTYLLSASYILYTCFVLAVVRIPRLEDRLKIFAGASIAMLALVLGFRQLLPNRVTYWEAILLGTLVLWAFYELNSGISRGTRHRTRPA
jgi:hypothetical protein